LNTWNDVVQPFLSSQALVWGPMVAAHQLRSRGWIRESIGKPMHTVTFTLFGPLIYALGVWRLDLSFDRWYLVPIANAILLILSTLAAVILVPVLARSRQARGTLSIMIPISNQGYTLAGFLTILFISDEAYGYNALLMIPAGFLLPLLWLPLAEHWGRGEHTSIWVNYRRGMFSPMSLPLVGVIIGLLLNMLAVPMPAVAAGGLRWLVFLATANTMFALGACLHVRHLFGFFRTLRWVFLFKFVLHPALMFGLCLLLQLKGMAAAALFIASIMPAGVMSVSLSSIYRLDLNLGNAGYLWTTLAFMIIVLPILIFLLRLPLFAY